MEGQLHRTHGRHEDPQHHPALHSVMEGEGEHNHNHNHNHHGEKKSVLTKVKDKAKKIKDKIKHAGHTHDDDDYDDEDEETVNRSDLHPAPIVNESAFISGTALPKQTGLNLENPAVPLEDRLAPTARDEAYGGVRNAGARNDEMYTNDPFMNTSSLPVQSTYNPNIGARDFPGFDPDKVGPQLGRDTDHRHHTSFESEQRAYVADPTVKIGPLGGLKEDPYGPGVIDPPSNYQSKVTDPTRRGPLVSGEEADFTSLLTRLDNPRVDDESKRKTGSYIRGGEEADVTPLLRHLDNPRVGDDLERKTESYTTGSEEADVALLSRRLDNPRVTDESQRKIESYTAGGEEADETPVLKHLDNFHFHNDDEAERRTESYTTGGGEVDVTPLSNLLDNLHFDDESQRKTGSYTTGGEEVDVTPLSNRLDNLRFDDESQRKTGSNTRGGEEVDVTPLLDRLVDDETEEMDYTGSHDQFAPTTEQFNPKSFDEEMPESLPQDTIAGKISAATSVITDKAAAAKNVVASKLGYGATRQEEAEAEVDYTGSHDQFAPKSLDEEMPESMPQDTVAGKISAATSVITDKAAAAKNAVAPKLGYGATTQEKEAEVDYTGSLDQFAPKSFDEEMPESMPQDTVAGKISAATSVITDKVAAAKNAVASKLGYGATTQDKEAEAEVSKVQGRGVGEEVGGGGDKGVSVQGYLVEKLRPGEEDRELSKVITEAIHGTPRREEEKQPMTEMVTVEAVAPDEKAAAGVVDRVKGAIGSWLGKKGDDGEGLEKEIASKLQE